MHVELYAVYEQRKELIRERLREFRNVPPSEYFYEMAYCLLTPQTQARNAERAVLQLKKHRFHERNIDPLPLLHCETYYIRFHHTKAARLQLLKKVHEQAHEIILDPGLDAFVKREKLVALVNGFGLKEATHFLRNIGKNDGLAILDRHILRNLKRFGVVESVPASISRREYYSLEKKFQAFSLQCEIPLDELDLLFWSMQTGTILK